MKQNVKPSKKNQPPKKPAQFSIDMDVKGIGFFLLLGIGAALIVFYLGYTAGLAKRDPNKLSQKQPTPVETVAEAKVEEVKKDLKIYDIREDSGVRIEALKKSSKETLSDANRIIAESKQDPSVPQEASKPTPEESASEKKEPEFTPQWPEKTDSDDDEKGLYTYQITSTKDIQKATTLVKHLKRKGFDAYRVAFKFKGELFYRVRVGRGSKSELRKIEPELKRVIRGEAEPQLMPYGK